VLPGRLDTGKADLHTASFTPFSFHLQTAVNKTVPGDTMYLMDGVHTYNAVASSYNGNAVGYITAANSGKASAPITYRAYQGHHLVVTVLVTR
jgi:hypothetical protein